MRRRGVEELDRRAGGEWVYARGAWRTAEQEFGYRPGMIKCAPRGPQKSCASGEALADRDGIQIMSRHRRRGRHTPEHGVRVLPQFTLHKSDYHHF